MAEEICTEEYVKDSSDSERGKNTKENSTRRVKAVKCRRGSAGTRDSSQDTTCIFGQGSRSITDKNTFNVNVLPDSGCTISLLPEWICKKYKLKINHNRTCKFSLRKASGEKMIVVGTTAVLTTPSGCNTKRSVDALFCPDLNEHDILSSWRDMKCQIWGLLSLDFPQVKNIEEGSCRKIESGTMKETDEEGQNKKMKAMLKKKICQCFW